MKCEAEVPAAHATAGRLPRRSRPVQLATSRPTCPRTFVRRALFLAWMSVGDARVYTCTCTVHDKLSCTRLQNYTIGASRVGVGPMEFKLICYGSKLQARRKAMAAYTVG